MKKRKKSPLFAAIANFLFWGIGYIYLEKKVDKAFYLLVAYFGIWIFSFWYTTVAGPLVYSGLVWVLIWYFMVSFYNGYDAYLLARMRK